MAIYHLSVKPISRSAGRSATGAAAYRAGEKVVDSRTGEIHDYTRKRGVIASDIVLPDSAAWTPTRSELWNAAEQAEKRKDACVAREHEVAIPAELNPEQQRDLIRAYCRNLANRHGCAVDYSIHEPGKGGDNRNIHAHILCTTRQVDGQGLGQKCQREQAGQKRKDDMALERKVWGDFANRALARAGLDVRVSHKTLEDQGIDRTPGKHLGPTATAIQRKGQKSHVAERIDVEKAVAHIDKYIEDARDQAEKIGQVIDQAKARQQAERKAAIQATAEKERQAREERRQEWQAKRLRRSPGITPRDSVPPPPGKPRVWEYSTGPAKGYAAVIDYGDRLRPAGHPDKISDAKIAAMLQIAEQKGWKSITVTGEPAFRVRVCEAAMQRGLGFLDADLQGYAAAKQREAQERKQERERIKAQMEERRKAWEAPPLPNAPAPSPSAINPAPQALPAPQSALAQARAAREKVKEVRQQMAERHVQLSEKHQQQLEEHRLVREHEQKIGYKLNRWQRLDFLRDHRQAQEAAEKHMEKMLGGQQIAASDRDELLGMSVREVRAEAAHEREMAQLQREITIEKGRGMGRGR